jgi:glyoxylase-like metal-dependent hydrolase (beta-lactamase superfamily II)
VNGDGAVAVDSQFMNTAEICVAGLKGRAPKGIAMLINTHHHGDHTGGNRAFKESAQKIVSHEACAAWHRKTAEQAGTVDQQAFADTTFAETWKADSGERRSTRAITVPGIPAATR